jgi:hypothetical protein
LCVLITLKNEFKVHHQQTWHNQSTLF